MLNPSGSQVSAGRFRRYPAQTIISLDGSALGPSVLDVGVGGDRVTWALAERGKRPHIKRRSFVAAAGLLATPTAPSRAQIKRKAVVGFLNPQSLKPFWRPLIAEILRPLAAAGYVDGQNLSMEYRWADNHLERLPVLAAELVARQADVIVAIGGDAAARAAKDATSRIPIVFSTAGDPVAMGLVPSISRPGSNVTGVSTLTSDLGPKRLELLLELVPGVQTIGLLVSPASPSSVSQAEVIRAAARARLLDIVDCAVTTSRDLESAFATLQARNVTVLMAMGDMGVTTSVTFREISTLAIRYGVASVFAWKGAVTEGALLSYGADSANSYRQVGTYVARILDGAKPADLPVYQSVKFALAVNLATAKALGLTIAPSILARADEVIE